MCLILLDEYGKCSKFSYIKVSHKMAYANSTGPDQTSGLFGALTLDQTINRYHWGKVFEILVHLLYTVNVLKFRTPKCLTK